MDDVRAHVGILGKKVLVELVVKQAAADERLRRRLLMEAAKKTPKGLDVETYLRAIDAAVEADDFVDYHAVYGYAQRIDEVVDSVTALLNEGYATEAIELAEHALAALERARWVDVKSTQRSS